MVNKDFIGGPEMSNRQRQHSEENNGLSIATDKLTLTMSPRGLITQSQRKRQ